MICNMLRDDSFPFETCLSTLAWYVHKMSANNSLTRCACINLAFCALGKLTLIRIIVKIMVNLGKVANPNA